MVLTYSYALFNPVLWLCLFDPRYGYEASNRDYRPVLIRELGAWNHEFSRLVMVVCAFVCVLMDMYVHIRVSIYVCMRILIIVTRKDDGKIIYKISREITAQERLERGIPRYHDCVWT